MQVIRHNNPIESVRNQGLHNELNPTEKSQLIALFNAKRYDELKTRTHHLIRQYPNSGFAWLGLGLALKEQGEDALSALQRATELIPDDSQAHFNLGNTFYDLKRFDDAAASYERALKIQPDFAAAHDNLGNALMATARFEEALTSYQRALKIKPDFAQAYNNQGSIFWALGQYNDALSSYRQALVLHPGFAEAHYNLGNTQKDLGRFDEAAASYRRALQIKPNDAATHCNLGIVLRLQGKPIDAEATCRQSLALEPDMLPAIILLAELRADQGQFSEVEQLYLRAISITPDSPDAWAGITRSRKMTNDDSDWLASANQIVASGLPPRREVPLRYAIGKYHDDVRDYEKSFFNYRLANELTKAFSGRYDRDAHERTVKLRTKTYHRAWIERHRQRDNTSARPIFIVGMPRSGTTLAEQILASHPAIFGAGELPFWGSAIARFEASPFGTEHSDPVLCSLAHEYQQLQNEVAGDSKRIVDKMPGNFMQLGLIHAVFPHARIIHIQRNPIDTCLSIYFQRLFETVHPYANDLEDLAHYYTEYVQMMAHWQQTLPPQTILNVPYEGLVTDQEKWSRKMLDFVDMTWDACCLDFHQSVRTVNTTSNWQVRQKISTASLDRWRNYEQFVGPLKRLVSTATGSFN